MPDADRRIPALIFLTVLCIGLFAMQGKVRDSDAYPMVLTTQAICEQGTVAIENLTVEGNPVADDWANMHIYWAHTEDHQYGGRNDSGQLFSKYGILSSVVFIPLWYVGMLLASLLKFQGADGLSFIVFISGITIPLLLALCGVLLYRISRFFDYTPRTSAFLALALTLCSNLLVYGGMYMSEVPQVTFMLLGWYFLFGFSAGDIHAPRMVFPFRVHPEEETGLVGVYVRTYVQPDDADEIRRRNLYSRFSFHRHRENGRGDRRWLPQILEGHSGAGG